MRTNNFKKKSKLGKLEFEPESLRKEFYTYIKIFNLTTQKIPSQTTLAALRNNLIKELELEDDE